MSGSFSFENTISWNKRDGQRSIIRSRCERVLVDDTKTGETAGSEMLEFEIHTFVATDD